MNVLVACEESQAVCLAFRKLGHNAYSCDLQDCSGGHPEYHFKGAMFDVIANRGGTLENGTKHFLDGNWDLVIAHPPCTFLAVSGARWYYHPDDKNLPTDQRRPHPKFPDRAKDREDAVQFFYGCVKNRCEQAGHRESGRYHEQPMEKARPDNRALAVRS